MAVIYALVYVLFFSFNVAATSSHTNNINHKADGGRYIIKFNKYLPIHKHWSTIRSFLGPPIEGSVLNNKGVGGDGNLENEYCNGDGQGSYIKKGLWKPVGIRQKQILEIPTDFVVISLLQKSKDSVINALKTQINTINNIYPDSTLHSLSTIKPTSYHINETKTLWPQSTLPIRKSWAFHPGSHASFKSSKKGEDEKEYLKKSSRLSKILSKKSNEESKKEKGGGIDNQRKKLSQRSGSSHVKGTVTSKEAASLHRKGLKGQNVKVAVFDTGIHEKHPHFKNVIERINWTDDKQLYDSIGHGTFVAGVICSSNEQCPGWAPDVDLYTFRVFTTKQVSYTSWFLDAFNYAIWREIDVLNLSIGGPDHADRPFVEKIWEMTANGIIVVSAIGNDGPLYGTLNNPADNYDTIGVGGLNNNGGIAKFSSRGMTLWETPFGYGRFKPDVTAMGTSVIGSKMLSKDGQSGCRALSGTSVASPVVAGAVALLLSDLRPQYVIKKEKVDRYELFQRTVMDAGAKAIQPPEDGIYNIRRHDRASPAAIKQVLVQSAVQFDRSHVFEQGAGRLNITLAHDLLSNYQPHASFLPSSLIATSTVNKATGLKSECKYMWPYCTQPLYTGSVPYIFNLTLINGLAVSGQVENVKWIQTKVIPTDTHDSGNNDEKELLYVSCEHSSPIWPWSGYFAVSVSTTSEAFNFNGVVGGILQVTVSGTNADNQVKTQVLELPIEVDVIPTPPRSKRILWDQFHNLGYPSGYFPRDDLKVQNDMLDWTGDHIHTNFKAVYEQLRLKGYYVEVLSEDYTCFDADEYGALLLVDPEEEFFQDEIEKLERDLREKGLSLIVFADWYSVDAMNKVAFFDDNTRSQWTAVTGGSNVPALNDLLSPLGVSFSDRIFDGTWTLSRGNTQIPFKSGVSIAKFPQKSWLRKMPDLKERSLPKKGLRGKGGGGKEKDQPNQGGQEGQKNANTHITSTPAHVLGCFDLCESSTTGCASSSSSSFRDKYLQKVGSKVVVYGDSSCLDSWQGSGPMCIDLLISSLDYATSNTLLPSEIYFRNEDYITKPYVEDIKRPVPQRLEGNELYKYSNVISNPEFETKTHLAGESCTWRERMRRV